MSTKRRIKMSRNNEACSEFYRKRHATAERMHCSNLTRYAFKVFLLLFLFFMLPHTVNGIANEVEKPKQNIVDMKSPMTPSNQSPTAYNEPHFLENRTVIVEFFEWKFVDVSAECTNFLGPKGYAGVQLSPVTEHLLGGVQAQSWLARYQPISFKFATRSGSVEDFLAMSRACNAAGVRVYVDVVLNHMAGDTTSSDDSLLVGTAGSVANISILDYSGVPFEALDFHKACMLTNYFDSYEVRNCQLNGQPDLNHSRVTVHERIVEFLNQLIEMGVAGFRIDAAKYMWPNELKSIYAAVNNLNSEEFGFEKNSRPLFYQEMVDLGIDAVSKTEYSSLGIVTEYLYAAELSTIFRGTVPLSSLINWGPAMGFLPHHDALVFVDTHDSQHGYLERELGKNLLLSYKQQRRYIMATAFMLAHPYGRIKRILSSYYFPANDKERGPPTVESADENISDQPSILSPEIDSVSEQCTPANGWICEHRWPAVVNLVALANVLSATEDGVIDFQTYGPNQIAFCRGQKAFIAINNDASLDYTTTVHTYLEPGIYCDIISGGRKANGNDCQGKRIVVKENGMVDLKLPAFGGIDNIAIDIDSVDAVDVNEDAEWKGTDVDVDYGVIAIYIDSKLVNNENRVQNSEMVDENKPENDLTPKTMETESNAVISADQMQVEGIDENSTVNTMDGQTVGEVVQEESNIENAVEAKPEEVMKSNAAQCAMAVTTTSSGNKTEE